MDKEHPEEVEVVGGERPGLSSEKQLAEVVQLESSENGAEPINTRKTLRKIDVRIIPMVCILYLLSFLDRGNVGNAKVLGMADDLHLTGNRYNLVYTVFFFPYSFLEVPANLILKKLRPSIWLPSIMVAWGIVCTLTGTVQSYHGLLVARVFLGVAESGQYPGVTYYLSMWYAPQDLGFRSGMFYSGAAFAGAFSGLLAFAIDKMEGVGGYAGWRWIFIIEGLVTVVVGVAAYFLMHDYADTAKFLTPAERNWVTRRVKDKGTSGSGQIIEEHDKFQWKYVWAAWADWQIWLAIISDLATSCTVYGMSAFLPTIVKELGYTGNQANLLTIPPYVLACILVIVLTYWSDRVKKRSIFILCLLCVMFGGYCLALAGAIHEIHGLTYTGVFISTACCYPSFVLVVTWIMTNLAPSLKRAVGAAVLVGVGNMSGPMGSNFYRSQDAPQFILGHSLELMMIALGITTTLILRLSYNRINAARDKAAAEGRVGVLTEEELSGLGDRAPTFRYYL